MGPLFYTNCSGKVGKIKALNIYHVTVMASLSVWFPHRTNSIDRTTYDKLISHDSKQIYSAKTTWYIQLGCSILKHWPLAYKYNI